MYHTIIRRFCTWYAGRLTGLILLATVVSAYGQVPESPTIHCNERPISLAFYDYGLLYTRTRQGTQAGIDKDVVDELHRRSGCEIKTVVMARARIWAEMAAGRLDMTVSGIRTPERERFAWFAPYLIMKNFAIVAKRNAGSVRSFNDFLENKSLKFGAVRSFKHGEEQDNFLAQLRIQNRVEDNVDAPTLFDQISTGKIDAIFSQPLVYGKYIVDFGLREKVNVQDWTPAEKGVPHGLVLAKNRFSDEDAKQWSAMLTAMRDDGTLLRIYSAYVSKSEALKLLNY